MPDEDERLADYYAQAVKSWRGSRNLSPEGAVYIPEEWTPAVVERLAKQSVMGFLASSGARERKMNTARADVDTYRFQKVVLDGRGIIHEAKTGLATVRANQDQFIATIRSGIESEVSSREARFRSNDPGDRAYMESAAMEYRSNIIQFPGERAYHPTDRRSGVEEQGTSPHRPHTAPRPPTRTIRRAARSGMRRTRPGSVMPPPTLPSDIRQQTHPHGLRRGHVHLGRSTGSDEGRPHVRRIPG